MADTSDPPIECVGGGVISSTDSIRIVYDAHTSKESATVCIGWVPRGGAAPTSHDHAAQMGRCKAVSPLGIWRPTAQKPPSNAVAFWIRVDFDDATDKGVLVVYVDDVEVARIRLDGCGTAIWSYYVLR